jgi:hypothetical protein
MDTDLNTVATAPDVKIDGELKTNPDLRIAPPEVGIAPKLSDAELITMAVLQAFRVLAHDTDSFEDDTWVIDSSPVDCGLSTERQTKRAGLFAGDGYCVRPPDSSSRYVSSSSRSTTP